MASSLLLIFFPFFVGGIVGCVVKKAQSGSKQKITWKKEVTFQLNQLLVPFTMGCTGSCAGIVEKMGMKGREESRTTLFSR